MWEEWTAESGNTTQTILVGRGCPYNCSYCSNHALKKLAEGKYVRFRTPENIIKEIKQALTKFPQTKEIYFEVETIDADRKFAIELCAKIEKLNKEINNRLTYGINLRIIQNTDYEELFNAFKKANFSFVNIGLESGSKRVRTEILRRHYSNEDIINAANTARKYGLKINTYALIGLPGETREEFKETINCLRPIQPDEARPSIFFPYPGTDLYNVCKEKYCIPTNINPRLERRKANINFPNFSKKQIQKEFTWFYYNIYKDYMPLKKILIKSAHQYLLSKYYAYTILKYIKNTILRNKFIN